MSDTTQVIYESVYDRGVSLTLEPLEGGKYRLHAVKCKDPRSRVIIPESVIDYRRGERCFSECRSRNIEIRADLVDYEDFLWGLPADSVRVVLQHKPKSLKGFLRNSACKAIEIIADTSECENMSSLCFFCKNLQHIDLSHLDTRNLKDASEIFCGCISLASVNLCGLNFRKLESLYAAFWMCTSLTEVTLNTIDLSKREVDMDFICYNCVRLTDFRITVGTLKSSLSKESFNHT